ncbi:DUF4333 domain-containing protein [Nocardia sp. NPDC058176]|uniref:DUF4333 domain-containing protein n=1 Tax=Nocardia sp. NPDC058176 TaxID=3346368 RepID=UPI0036DDA6BB
MSVPLSLALFGCSASFSIGGPDYGALEKEIATELDKSYESISRKVDSVECPRPDKKPKAGETFLCNATVDGKVVRVEVTVEDDEDKVRFESIDLAFDLEDTARLLTTDVSDKAGFPVTVDCGQGLEIVAIGDTFTCTALDDSGGSAIVEMTAGPGGSSNWKLIE